MINYIICYNLAEVLDFGASFIQTIIVYDQFISL